MPIVKIPSIIKKTFPKLTWDAAKHEKAIYLTFDDGPTPQITTWVLDILKQYQAKATFFCLGKNVEQNPQIFEQIIAEGHSVGNHTYQHLNAWKVSAKDYLKDIQRCEKVFKSTFFRPPYGKINPKVAKQILSKYKVVMWNIMSYDFDANVSPEKCFRYVEKNARRGSIIVFHDSVKAKRNMQYAVEKTLAHYSKMGYVFKAL